MQSDFAGARLCLEKAFHLLGGSNVVSVQAREAIGLLIAAMMSEEEGQAGKPETSLRPASDHSITFGA
ncbi:hypothetical protein [Mesorhizobium sp. WSM2239]|uniref:Uncharacterized protein n=2 Tax=unclassified Mesorhizobium TaxID=325217 RepID=A0AAU8DA62_9HYPH